MLLLLPSLAQLLLNQDITMDMVMVDMVDMVDMDMDTMEREKLSLTTTIMAMDIMDMVDMVMATMERGKPKQLPLLSQDTITMDTAIMEVMDTAIMERERLMLSPVIIIMAMDMVMVMAMVMDTMVKQQLFIDSSIFSIIDLDFLKSSQQKHTIIKNKQNSLFEKIKKMKLKNRCLFLFFCYCKA